MFTINILGKKYKQNKLDKKNISTNINLENTIAFELQNSVRALGKIKIYIGDSEDMLLNIRHSLNDIYETVDNQELVFNDIHNKIEEYAASFMNTYEELELLQKSFGNTVNLVKNNEIKFNSSITDTEEIKCTVSEIKHATVNFKEKLNAIEQFLISIENISKKTNLLAINASIESSRAGEAGKGFMVIAKEVRELSNNANVLTKDIKETLNISNQEVDRINYKVEESVNKVANNIISIKDTLSSYQDILVAINTISSNIETISLSLENQYQNITLLSSILKQIEDLNQNIRHAVDNENLQCHYAEEVLHYLNERYASTGYNSDKNKEKNKIKINMYVPTFPDMETSYEKEWFENNTKLGLVQLGVNGELIPAIAKSWQLSKDGLIWKFRIKRNLYFHNGKPITTSDIVYSIEKAIEEEANAFKALCEIEYVKNEDDTIIIKTATTFEGLVNVLASIKYIILDKEELIKNNKIISAGPYKLENINDNEYKLIAFEKCAVGIPYVDEIKINLTPFNEITEKKLNDYDMIFYISGGKYTQDLEQMCQSLKYNKLKTKPFALTLLHLSSQTIFKNPIIRQAILMALDMGKIYAEISKVYGEDLNTKSKGILDNFFRDSERLYNYKLSNHDVNGAINLLKKHDLWPISKTIKIGTLEGTQIKPILNFIKEDLESIGIKSEIVILPRSSFLDEQSRVEISLFQLTFDTLDPYQTLYDILDMINELDNGTKEKILDSKKILLHHEKNKKLQDIEKEYLDYNYVIPICHSKAIILSKNELNGIYTNDLDTIFLDEVYIR